ncbi:hypothetical protein BYT27DRAFT_7214085 [Phlegmacium glaucopus]|nr:hypothetical protein BYT27DRAFT_7214085 [Phlegmacium glaucopus]
MDFKQFINRYGCKLIYPPAPSLFEYESVAFNRDSLDVSIMTRRMTPNLMSSTTFSNISTIAHLEKMGSSSSNVYTRHLTHTPHQVATIKLIYEQCKHDIHYFEENQPESQYNAQLLLVKLGLDRPSRCQLESRWNVQWSTSWTVGSRDKRRRILYQCACGYDPKTRQKHEERKHDSPAKNNSKTWQRRVPYEYTGCLAHVEITERESNGEVTRVVGYFAHNAACQSAVLTQLPAVPLHEHVYKVALDQLEDGASISAIQEKNRSMIDSRAYDGMQENNPSNVNVRYHFLPTDNSTLYQKFSRHHGIDVRQQPQYNIDDWLNPTSSNFNPIIREAIFHYSARSEADERFEICISTPEMDAGAWKYAHQSQIVLDGTFGVCSSRLLLFIALARDEDGKGVPVTFLLFSAPTGNRATHAGYNTAILQKLLSQWERHLSNGSETPFTPLVAITDTDTKERGALLNVWPQICLLICKFHLRQCWTNHQKSILRCAGTEFWKDHVKGALASLEVKLIGTVDHSVAIVIINQQRAVFERLLSDTASLPAAHGGMKHLDYLVSQWMPLPMWKSWSGWGRVAASTILKIPVEGVIPTTNHLESFNAILKRKHLAAHLHSGHRLRFDSLIHLLITRILPGVYQHRKAQHKYKQWLSTRFQSCSGGVNLFDTRQKLMRERSAPLCWWEKDTLRENGALEILCSNRLSITRGATVDKFTASCESLNQPSPYQIDICRSGEASCSCPDFASNGGACKHLRAVRQTIDWWVSNKYEAPFNYPQSKCDAEVLASHRRESCVVPTDRKLSIQSLLNPITVTSLTHRPPSPPVIPWNPIVIQALGDDGTTLDEQEDPRLTELASNTGSVSEADTESESDRPEWSGAPIQFDHDSQHLAISMQVKEKINYEIKKLLPSLHGIANLLVESSLSSKTASQELREFLDVTSIIHASISQYEQPQNISDTLSNSRNDSKLCPEQTLPISEQLSSFVTDQTQHKRKRPAVLLPPSPERRQKWKASHAPL